MYRVTGSADHAAAGGDGENSERKGNDRSCRKCAAKRPPGISICTFESEERGDGVGLLEAGWVLPARDGLQFVFQSLFRNGYSGHAAHLDLDIPRPDISV